MRTPSFNVALAVAIACSAGGGAGAWGAATIVAPPFPPDVPMATSALAAPKLPASVEATRQADGSWQVELSFRPASPMQQVAVAGDFNRWSASSHLMQRGADGVWRARVAIDGTVRYKFVLTPPGGGVSWVSDPVHDDREPDGHGGFNSVLRLGAQAALQSARGTRGDGRIEAAAIRHEPRAPLGACAMPDGTTMLRLRTLAGDVERVRVAVDGVDWVGLAEEPTRGAFAWWSGTVRAPRGAAYTFLLSDGTMTVRDPMTYSLAPTPAFTTPEWAKHASWYQVFPERFRNGDPSNDPQPVRPWRSAWYEPSEWEGKDGQTFFNHFVFSRKYGGDLQGLRWALPYLKSLGINAIYLNPIFQARTAHKYDATNYLHVDEHFGVKGDYAVAEAKEDLLDPTTWTWTPTDRLFLDFLKEAKSMGMRVIIDGVFNHVGTEHPAFKDVQSKGKESRFADWFEITSWEPFVYQGWAGFGELPAFRKDKDGLASPSLRKHLMDVTRRWMDPDGDGDPGDGVDGWRLDVPQEVPIGFWREWCAHVRSINPQAYIVGEIWTVEPEWVDGRCFDALMNYPFAKAVLPWLAKGKDAIPVSEMDARLADLRRSYPDQVTFVAQNLYDSHDTDRLASMLLNRDLAFKTGSREQENAAYLGTKPGAEAYARMRLAAFIQMTHPGAPMIYYGDEVGMYGADDPTNRKPMLWKDLEPYELAEDTVDTAQLDWYRRVIALRSAHSALRTGSFSTVLVDDARDLWGWLREDGAERLLVVVNGSDRTQAAEPDAAFRERITGAWDLVFDSDPTVKGAGIDGMSIPAIGARVWRQSR